MRAAQGRVGSRQRALNALGRECGLTGNAECAVARFSSTPRRANGRNHAISREPLIINALPMFGADPSRSSDPPVVFGVGEPMVEPWHVCTAIVSNDADPHKLVLMTHRAWFKEEPGLFLLSSSWRRGRVLNSAADCCSMSWPSREVGALASIEWEASRQAGKRPLRLPLIDSAR